MSYEITGQHRGDRGGTIATSAETPRAALDIARQWAEQGIRNIAIRTPTGESFDVRDEAGERVGTARLTLRIEAQATAARQHRPQPDRASRGSRAS
jgi:hypothetical protein